MVTKEVRDSYTVTIGIECHVQLKTVTKLFAAVGNDAREAPPNTLISHICLGMPGALPVLNAGAVQLATKAAFALGTKPQRISRFDRKHYFYPDLPMGYQITQFYEPIIRDGQVTIHVNGQTKVVRIHEAHLEADAGKNTHPAGKDYSLVDLNRAGTPLLEIVSEPDMHSAEEARAYVRELWLRMRYAGVSDANLYYGNMRFDVNVSVNKDPVALGTRTETKNLNSFRSVEKAIEFEVDRQIELLEKGERIVQETRGWDEAKQRTFSQRGKEEAHDYRYMPDPDLPPVVIEASVIAAAKSEMPMMPEDLRSKLAGIGVDNSAVETLLEEMPAGRFMLKVIEQAPDKAKIIANWLVGPVQSEAVASRLDWDQVESKLNLQQFSALADMQQNNMLSSTAAKEVLLEMLATGSDPEAIAQSKDLLQVSDEGAIAEIVAKVIAENPKAAEDVRNGEMKAIGFLVGQVMKQSQGKANPGLAQELLKKQLSN